MPLPILMSALIPRTVAVPPAMRMVWCSVRCSVPLSPRLKLSRPSMLSVAPVKRLPPAGGADLEDTVAGRALDAAVADVEIVAAQELLAGGAGEEAAAGRRIDGGRVERRHCRIVGIDHVVEAVAAAGAVLEIVAQRLVL